MNLIEGALGYLNAGVIEKASALVGESPVSTRRGLTTAVPAIVAALAGQAVEPTGASRIVRALEDAGLRGTPENVSERLGARSGEDLVALGKDLLGRVFGGRIRGVVDATAGSTGVKPEAMTSLFALAAPLVAGVLGGAMHARHLDAAGLAGFLGAQRAVATSALPAPVMSALSDLETRVPAPVPGGRGVARPGVSRAWPLLLLIPLAVLGGLYLRAGARRSDAWGPRARLGAGIERPAAPESAPGVMAPAVEPPAVAPPRPGTVVVDDVVTFLSGDGDTSSERFVFEDLTFELGTTNLMPGGRATLDRLAEALVAHPDARILVEGHTDVSGVPEHNARLSLERANAVKNVLVARGVAEDHIDTAGAGQDRPLVSNDTEEGRARNRRTEIVVTRR